MSNKHTSRLFQLPYTSVFSSPRHTHLENSDNSDTKYIYSSDKKSLFEKRFKKYSFISEEFKLLLVYSQFDLNCNFHFFYIISKAFCILKNPVKKKHSGKRG